MMKRTVAGSFRPEQLAGAEDGYEGGRKVQPPADRPQDLGEGRRQAQPKMEEQQGIANDQQPKKQQDSAD